MTTLRELPYFSKAHRKFRTYRDCPEETVEKFRGVLPAVIVDSWVTNGFEELSQGFLWTVDPDNFRNIIGDFIYAEQRSQAHVFMRTAFGSMILQYEGKIVHFCAVSMRHSELRGSLEATLEMDLGQPEFLKAIFFRDFFRKALPRLGKPSEDEVYGFEPMLPLGGKMNPDNLVKVNLMSHLHLLSQASAGQRDTQPDS